MSDQPIPEHQRPEGVDEDTVRAVGKISEALECVEEARGLLYTFHRRTGEADLMLGDGVQLLRDFHLPRGESVQFNRFLECVLGLRVPHVYLICDILGQGTLGWQRREDVLVCVTEGRNVIGVSR